MINSKKKGFTNVKGFTIVELVIVIAVIAILSAVLIPTFSNLVRKANISSDTVLAKNLNTALQVYDAENNVKEFDDALEGIKEAGYLIANLNAKTSGCFFVWEQETNQILLVDSSEDYKVLFSVKDGYGEPDESWHFAISNKDVAAQVKTQLTNVSVMQTVANVSDLLELIENSDGKPIYIDESVILTKDNLIEIDNSNVTLNLGSSSLNTNGILPDSYPIRVKSGKLTLNGGIIGAAGSYIDEDGRVVNTPLCVDENGESYIDGTTFNINVNGYVQLDGKNIIKNVTINTEQVGIYSTGKNELENTIINSKERVIWACNHNETKENAGKITIKSGTYTGGNSKWAAIVTCGSFVEIEGGDFYVNENAKLFQIHNNSVLAQRSTITITGGTFNGIPFKDLDVTEWNSLCGPNSKASISVDGKTVTISFSAE